jgi:hypothetical protein
MSTGQEIGWQSKYDEGLRVMTSSDHLAGIRATLTLPTQYQSPNPWSYFNFYLGINFSQPAGAAVEAGVSFGLPNVDLNWRTFINPGPSKVTAGLSGSLDLALFIQDAGKGAGYPVLFVNGVGPIKGEVWGRCGKVKMVAAMHEDKGSDIARETWYDKAVFRCTGVLEYAQPASATPATIKWKPWSSIAGLAWHLQRPDSYFRRIQCSCGTGDNFTTTMVKLGVRSQFTGRERFPDLNRTGR